MVKKFSFWIWAAIVTQLLTAAFHSLSFFVKQEPANESEKQLIDITGSYKADLGMGFHRTFSELFMAVSLCFTFICIFGALVNWYFKKKSLPADLWKGLLLIQVIIFGAVFATMLAFTFFPPIFCTGLIFVFVTLSYITVNNK